MDESKKKVKEFDDGVQKSKKELQDWTGKAKKAGMALTAFAAGVGAASFKLAQAAGEAEDTQGKFEAVFKDMTDEASVFVEHFADKFDMAESSVEEWMSKLKDTFDPLGIATDKSLEWGKALTALALDTKTFYPELTSVGDAINRFTSFLVGNHEAVRVMGVVVNETMIKNKAYEMGIANVGEELTEVQKMTARYELLLNGLQNAKGNATRELDGFNMALTQVKEIGKETAEVYGNDLMPTITKIINGVKNFLKWLRDLPPELRKTISQATILSGIIAGLTGPLLLIVGYLPQIATGLALIQKKFIPFLIGGAIVASLTFIVNKFIEWRKNVDLLKDNLKNLGMEEAQKRLSLLESKKNQLLTRAFLLSGSSMSSEEWIERYHKEEMERLDKEISATKEYISELKRREEEEKKLAAAQKARIEYEKQLTQAVERHMKKVSESTTYDPENWSYQWEISNLELIKNQMERAETDEEGLPGIGQWDWTRISEEKRLALIEKVNDEITRLKNLQAIELENIEENFANTQMELNLNQHEYKIYLLEQEQKAVEDAYYRIYGGTKEYLEKQKEIRGLYGRLISREEEDMRHAEMQAELRKQQFLLQQREISYYDYLDYIEKQLEAEKEHTDNWYSLMQERQNTLNTIVQNEMKHYQEQSEEMFKDENERITWLINKLMILKERYADNNIIVHLLGEEIKKLRDNITDPPAEDSLNWLENMFVAVGYKAEEAQRNFQDFRDALVDGLTAAITKGENFLDTLKNIADQIEALIVKRGIVEPFVDWMFTSLFPTGHTGGLITVNGIETFHTGGMAGMKPLRADEKIIKTKVGEIILNQEQQKGIINSQQSTRPEVNVEVINNTGTPIQTRKEVKFDGTRTIVRMFMEGYARNVDGIQDIIKRR